jgi:cytochrome c554/c'-like protein
MLTTGLLLLLWVLSQSADRAQAAPPTALNGAAAARTPHTSDQYAGVEACRPCHNAIVQTYTRTGHWLSSRLASPASMSPSFTAGGDVVPTSNPELQYRVEARPDGFFQTAVIGPPGEARLRTQRIDLVIGSGRRGQTYLWWRGDELLQLPLSYWNELKAWGNSPGYSDRTADFTHPVIPRCLDCHATFADAASATSNRFNKTTMLLGISCEKCHGPAADHVAAHRSNRRSRASEGRDVVNPARLDRERRVDLCGSCHGGQILGAPFSFVPGDPIKRPAIVARTGLPGVGTGTPVNLGIDSHGQQMTALMNSRCFQSGTMTCETCHKPHATGAVGSEHCLTCHKVDGCGRFAKDGRAIAGRCVDCHMPVQSSSLILSTNAGRTAQAHLRSHLIAVYPDGPRR